MSRRKLRKLEQKFIKFISWFGCTAILAGLLLIGCASFISGITLVSKAVIFFLSIFGGC